MDRPFTVDLHVRYRDLDTYDHVNNAVFATYLEEARIAYLEAGLEVDLDTFTFVIATLELSFERPLTLDDDLTVALEVTDLGRSSVTIAYDLRVDDGAERVATAETTLVSVDFETKRPTEIPPDVRERIVAHEELES